MKTDYPELEGKIVKVIFNNSLRKGKVIGVNYDVGITVVELNNLRTFFICLNRKIHTINSYSFFKYDYMFKLFIESIQFGIIDLDELNVKLRERLKIHSEGMNTECAFA